MENAEPLVSIIIPVYNAESTLPICFDALSLQGYASLEYIFVNDASTDGSLSMVEQFSRRFNKCAGRRVIIVTHIANKGVATARNSGLERATGDFIYYVDADDSIDGDAISMLIAKALETNADIVGSNWSLTFDKNARKMNQPNYANAWEAITKMLHGSMRWNLWLFLVKRAVYENNNIRFQPNMNMGEDMMVMIKLFVHADKVVFVDKALYHYRQSNATSLTKIYSTDHMKQVTANVQEVERFLLNSRYADKLGDLIGFLKLNIKLPLLISNKKEQYERWLNWFPEANALVMKNKQLPLRTRIVQFMAVKRLFWGLKVYYYFVIRLVYGIIYR